VNGTGGGDGHWGDLIERLARSRSDRKGLFKTTLLDPARKVAATQRIFYWRAATGAGTTRTSVTPEKAQKR